MYYEAHGLNILAWALAHENKLVRALPLAEQALAMLNDVDNPNTRAVIWDTLGLVHAKLGDPVRAIVCYEEAVVRFREFDMRQDLVKAQARRALLLGDVGRWAEARDTWRECLDLHLALGLAAWPRSARSSATPPRWPGAAPARRNHSGRPCRRASYWDIRDLPRQCSDQEDPWTPPDNAR